MAITTSRVSCATILAAVVLSGCTQTVSGVASPDGTSNPRSVANSSYNPEFAAIAGHWVGTYTCVQGDTGLTLIIDGSGRTEFQFYPLRTNAAPAIGAFQMQAVNTPAGVLEFRQTRWIDQPENYIMVDLVATDQTDATIVGNVIAPGCTTFQVRRDSRN